VVLGEVGELGPNEPAPAFDYRCTCDCGNVVEHRIYEVMLVCLEVGDVALDALRPRYVLTLGALRDHREALISCSAFTE